MALQRGGYRSGRVWYHQIYSLKFKLRQAIYTCVKLFVFVFSMKDAVTEINLLGKETINWNKVAENSPLSSSMKTNQLLFGLKLYIQKININRKNKGLWHIFQLNLQYALCWSYYVLFNWCIGLAYLNQNKKS